MRTVLIAAVAAVTLVSQVSGQAQAPAPAAPKVELTFETGGLVTLSATGATVREILAEWTRKGGTPFVGAERLPATSVTLQFDHRPETEVVASLLRSASGFVIGPRRAGSTGASGIEVVYVLATSTATAGSFTAAPQPAFTAQPQVSSPGSPDTEIQPVGPGRAGQPPTQDAPMSSAPRPSSVSGVAVPVVPVVPVATPPPSGPGRGGGGGGGR